MTDERDAIIALVRPVVDRMAHLSVDARITFFLGLLAQEICCLPPGDRRGEIERIQDDLPMILKATEDGMREALADNARSGM